MASKVEKLKNKLQSLIGDVVRQLHADAYGDFDATIPPVVDSLITAARQEGAAAERERIRKGAEKTVITVSETVQKNDGHKRWLETVRRTEPGYAIFASVLAPGKEGK